MEELPKEFETVVLGTGLPESIVAAAASRLDKSILQLDQNTFYGRDWAGFRLKELREYLSTLIQNKFDAVGRAVDENLLKDGEVAVPIRPSHCPITNFEEKIYVKDDVSETDIAPQSRQERYRRSRHFSGSSVASSGTSSTQGDESRTPTTPEAPPVPPRKQFSFDDVLAESKKFSLDLAPKLFWSNDKFVDLLTTSNVSRYASFRLVNSVATTVEGRITSVPFSQSAIFQYEGLSPSDKRKLVKFMTMCMDPGKMQEQMQAASQMKLGAYLDKLQLPNTLRKSLVNAVAMCTDQTSVPEALKRIRRFLQACGRYGANTSPFLFPVFGSGEYPQYFARVSAIFGGIQCLSRTVDHAVVSTSSNKVTAVISNHERIACENLVLPTEYVPDEWKSSNHPSKARILSRAILITDHSIFPRVKNDNGEKQACDSGFMRIAREDGDELGVLLVEASHTADICPADYRVVYLWMNAKSSARADLEPYVERLLEPFQHDRDGMPKVLWACYHNYERWTWAETTEQPSAAGDAGRSAAAGKIPANVRVVSGPSGSIDLEDVLEESKAVFEKMYPGLPFLPRIPGPDEIVLDTSDSPSLDQSGNKESENIENV
ncbi:hypothetical protein RvY_18638 [Ramazzottius varieornatus]|uniref:Rab proteins geranylgeranyltransferase component A n=1 Tax=Ramazzottius varieornatus TaxID=947166 RepID=A0A1D1WAS2_RAMVA|nr:hypothetical protein RvY_18638 [Ramazzottius varieornatus]